MRGLYVVKRIMGVPGDRIHLRNGVVYRNGEALNEPYIDHDQENLSDSYRNDFPAVPPSDEKALSRTGSIAWPRTSRETIWWCPPGIILPWAITGA